MLYVTTRNRIDGYSPQQTLLEQHAPDGGFFCPGEPPHFSPDAIDKLKNIPFNQCLADMLNLLFDKTLSSWDVDFCVGRYPVRIRDLGNRIVMAEGWHNPQWCFSGMVRSLARLLGNETEKGWPEVAVRIAVLFAAYGELLRRKLLQPGELMDISAVAGDMLTAVSGWYARQWGLPVGSIVCCCNENNTLWNLICHGQMHTDTPVVESFLPQADVCVPEGLECLIASCGNVMELEAYLGAVETGRPYVPGELLLEALRGGLYVSVISSQRILRTIPSVHASDGYLASPGSALGYAGLLDYRAKKGKYRCSLVMADESPRRSAAIVAQAMGISEAELKDLM